MPRADFLVDAARLAVRGTDKKVIVGPNWLYTGQGPLRRLEFVVGHHTATPSSAPGDYPSYNVVRNGRAGLNGLLSQLGLGRSGNVYVIGGELAWHAGVSYYAGYYDLNDEAIGIEAEDDGDGDWTEDQYFMYPRLVGALLHYMRRGTNNYASHRTIARPTGRKPDPAGISDVWMRQQASKFMRTISGGGGGGSSAGGDTSGRLTLLEDSMGYFVPGDYNTLTLVVPLRGNGEQQQQQLIIGWTNAGGLEFMSQLTIHWIKFFKGDGEARIIKSGNSVYPGDPWWGSSGDNWGVAQSGEVMCGIEYSFSCPVNENGQPCVGAVAGFREA